MSIKTIEVICVPCDKCKGLEARIRQLVKSIEMIHKVKIPFEFKQTTSLRDLAQYSVNPSQTPVVIVNGIVEFAGKLDIILLRHRLEAVHAS